MLERRNRGDRNPRSALIAFKPRQLLLAEQNTKTVMAITTTTKKQKKTPSLKAQQKSLLLHSVLQFLERSGFSKSLKRLLSEAEIEDDKWKASSLDLEEIVCTYLETGGYNNMDANIKEEQELKMDDVTEKDRGSISEETVTKKKKRRSDKENFADDMVDEPRTKSKGKKKSKQISNSLIHAKESSKVLKEPIDKIMSELQTNELSKKHKEKRAKKCTLTSETLDGDVEKEQLEALQGDEFTKKDKDKKKKRNKLPSESLDVNVNRDKLDSLLIHAEGGSEEFSKRDGKTDSSAKHDRISKRKKNKIKIDLIIENAKQCSLEDKNGVVVNKVGADSALKNISNIQTQEKKEGSMLQTLSSGEALNAEVIDVLDREKQSNTDLQNESFETSKVLAYKDNKDSKKRKRLLSEENKNHLGEEVSTEEFKCRKIEGLSRSNGEQFTRVDSPQVGDGSHDEGGKNGHCELQESPFRKLEVLANSSLETRKQHDGSTKPTSVKAFQRVKVDDVVFADQRLQDNSYWAKDGAKVGYGAKAQETLGQVRGRDFRHEKTKKKRGSYRGGLIDLQSHSVKFTYSDDD